MYSLKVGDLIQVTGDYTYTDKGSIGIIFKLDFNHVYCIWFNMTGKTRHFNLNSRLNKKDYFFNIHKSYCEKINIKLLNKLYYMEEINGESYVQKDL